MILLVISGSILRLVSDQVPGVVIVAAEAAPSGTEGTASAAAPSIAGADTAREAWHYLGAGAAVENRLANTIDVRAPAYGAIESGTGAANHTAIQRAMDDGAAALSVVDVTKTFNVSSDLITSSNLYLRGRSWAWIKQQGSSFTGGFLTNLRGSSADAATIQSDIVLENVNIDGAGTTEPVELEVASSTTGAVTFTSAASAVDDFYIGLAVADTTVANTGLRIIKDYIGSTRTATMSSTWAANPSAGTKMLVGYNDNAASFAAGLDGLIAIGGISKNYPASKQIPPGLGGKGFSLEQGVANSKIIGRHAENCGTGFFVQGVDGSFANGAAKMAVAIDLIDNSVKNCGSALTIAGINKSADPDGDANDSMITVAGLTYENSGHNPYRLVSSDQQKSGIINFLEAQNVSVSNVHGRNDSGYPNRSPGYPGDYATRVGYGLSGNIGAMVWGWGRNLKIDGFVHRGNVDNVIVVRRGRALGDDAGPTGAPRNCFNWDFRDIEHDGVINEYVIRIDPKPALRVAASELTGKIEVAVNGSFLKGGLIDPNMSAFSAITMTIRNLSGGATVIGTPAQIYAAGNTFAAFGAGVTDLRTNSPKIRQ